MDDFERIEWSDWFMGLCAFVSMRSLDQSTKCGCVAASEDNTILSVGYNGPIRGIDDSKVPQTRPEKYFYFEHSEANTIDNAAKHGICLNGSIFYITGPPCLKCFRGMVQSGAKNIFYGPIQAKCVTEQEKQIINEQAKERGMNVEQISSYDEIIETFKKCIKYLEYKKNQQI